MKGSFRPLCGEARERVFSEGDVQPDGEIYRWRFFESRVVRVDGSVGTLKIGKNGA